MEEIRRLHDSHASATPLQDLQNWLNRIVSQLNEVEAIIRRLEDQITALEAGQVSEGIDEGTNVDCTGPVSNGTNGDHALNEIGSGVVGGESFNLPASRYDGVVSEGNVIGADDRVNSTSTVLDQSQPSVIGSTAVETNRGIMINDTSPTAMNSGPSQGGSTGSLEVATRDRTSDRIHGNSSSLQLGAVTANSLCNSAA